MPRESDPRGLAKELTQAADKCGLTEFDVHGMVEDSFREVHELHLRRLDEQWDEEFERLGRLRNQQSSQFDVQQTGGENMTKPIKEFRAGSYRASIWENQHKSGDKEFTVHSVQVERRYKDKEGNWQSTNGFGKNDLPKLALVVSKSFEFLTMRERQPQDEVNGDSPEA